MPAPKKQRLEEVPGSTDELTRLVALDLKYRVPQGVLVHDLARAGLGNARIADRLGTTANTVNQQKRGKRPQWPK